MLPTLITGFPSKVARLEVVSTVILPPPILVKLRVPAELVFDGVDEITPFELA